MVRIDGSSGLKPLPEPAWWQRWPREAAVSSAGQSAGFGTIAGIDRSVGFHVHKLATPNAEHGALRPHLETVLTAYQAHLARRVRYSGPLTPVDLRV